MQGPHPPTPVTRALTGAQDGAGKVCKLWLAAYALPLTNSAGDGQPPADNTPGETT